jgi:hypothetical protein
LNVPAVSRRLEVTIAPLPQPDARSMAELRARKRCGFAKNLCEGLKLFARTYVLDLVSGMRDKIVWPAFAPNLSKNKPFEDSECSGGES